MTRARLILFVIAGCGLLAAGIGEALAESCAKTAGAAKARRYVRDCIAVSPATHPPCNARNACDLIIGEIKRSCALSLGNDRPAICAAYR